MITPLERDWLTYARELLTDLPHRQACEDAGGSPEHPGVDATDLRWPGYLGEDVKRHIAVLVVSNVHRNFASGTIGVADKDRLVEVTRRWRDRMVSDETYLRSTRDVYLAGFAGWRVGVHISYAVAKLGLSLRGIAYTNAARCQFPEIFPRLPHPGRTKAALQRLCLQRFPLSRLTSMLNPRLIIYTSTVAYDSAAVIHDALEWPTVGMHQLYGTLTRPLRIGRETLPTGTCRAIWTRWLAERLPPVTRDGPLGTAGQVAGNAAPTIDT